MLLSSDDPIVSGLHLVIQKLTHTIVEQSDRLEDAEQAIQASEFLRKETASLRIELKQVKKFLERAEVSGKAAAAENKSLRALVAESDAQRNSALHQVDVVSERLELTQQSNKVLQQQLDLCNLRYQALLDDVDKLSAARAAAPAPADIVIQRCSAASSAPRVIHRSAACQTFAPACDPLVVEQIARMKQEALGLEESLAEARAETTEVRCMLDGARAAFAEELAQARADTASVRQTMVVALSKEAEVTSGLKLEMQLQQEQVEGLKNALERAEGSLAAAKLDLGILERKHSRAVESMVEYREQSIGLEHQLDQAIEREEAAVAAAAVVAGSFKLCRRCSSEQVITGTSLSRESSTAEDPDPVSVMLRFGEYSDGEDGVATVTMATSQGGESTSSFSDPPPDIIHSL